ncbi:MAG: c-type cytochrome [Pseudomonadota bacterium]
MSWKKVLFYCALFAFALPVLAAAFIYVASEVYLADVDPPETFALPIPSGKAALENGRHIARTRGCFGCHGQQLQGQVFTDQWDWVERGVAPNLSIYAREATPAQLEAAIRHGINANGRAMYSMPSYNWVHLSDVQVAELIAFLQSVPPVENPLPPPRLGWAARWVLATRADDHMAALAMKVPGLKTKPADDPVLHRGERLAMTTCNECHGLDLRGEQTRDILTPDLAIVAIYSEAEFRRLMKVGVTKDGRNDLGLMSLVGPDRFPAFTEDELQSLYLYLSSLADNGLAASSK